MDKKKFKKNKHNISEEIARVCSVKKVFLKFSQKSQKKKTCARVSFLIKSQASGLPESLF